MTQSDPDHRDTRPSPRRPMPDDAQETAAQRCLLGPGGPTLPSGRIGCDRGQDGSAPAPGHPASPYSALNAAPEFADPRPLCLSDLFTLWESTRRFALPRQDQPLHHASILPSLAQAHLTGAENHVALLVNPTGRIVGVSAEAARRIPDLSNAELERLPFDAADTAKLHLAFYRALAQGHGASVTLRARNLRSGALMLLKLTAIGGGEGKPDLGHLKGIEIDWPDSLESILHHTFGLDHREENILRSLATGETAAEIATQLRISEAALSGEIAVLLRKSGTRSLSELLHFLLSLAEPEGTAFPAGLGDAAPGTLPAHWPLAPGPQRRDDSHQVTLDGRRFEWLEYGAPGGRPVLYMHFTYGMTRWSSRAIRAARQRGLRIIVPLRAGFGASSPLPEGTPWREGVIADYARISDHLGLTSMVAVTQGADLRYALALAQARPDLIRGVLGCAAQLPLATHSQFERMGRWQRFVLRNARYAPEVLPAVVRAAFATLHSLGIERMLRMLNESSPPDLATLDTPEAAEALISGISQALPPDPEAAPAIFVEECLDSESDWSELLLRASLPLKLMQADQDPFSPLQSLRELQEDFPHLDIEVLARTGQFLIYQRWPQVLDAIEELMRRKS